MAWNWATGQLTRNWQVFASYTYLDAELVKSGAANIGTRTNPIYVDGLYDGNEVPSTPKHSFSFWNTYNVTQDLTIGGGAPMSTPASAMRPITSRCLSTGATTPWRPIA